MELSKNIIKELNSLVEKFFNTDFEPAVKQYLSDTYNVSVSSAYIKNGLYYITFTDLPIQLKLELNYAFGEDSQCICINTSELNPAVFNSSFYTQQYIQIENDSIKNIDEFYNSHFKNELIENYITLDSNVGDLIKNEATNADINIMSDFTYNSFIKFINFISNFHEIQSNWGEAQICIRYKNDLLLDSMYGDDGDVSIKNIVKTLIKHKVIDLNDYSEQITAILGKEN